MLNSPIVIHLARFSVAKSARVAEWRKIAPTRYKIPRAKNPTPPSLSLFVATMAQQPRNPDGYHTIDLRVFLALMAASMAASFLVGAGLCDSLIADLFASGTTTSPPIEESPKSGEHLLMDIEGVEEAFLNSEERLAKAMLGTVEEAGLTMLSYHCHSLQPSGVSCVGVLEESHISFHTWPEDGVITLDLFTGRGTPLLPVVASMERLFGVGENTRTQWSHEIRGFSTPEDRKKNYLDDNADLSLWVLSPLDVYYKKQIYSDTTKYQRVDIWDVTEVRWGAARGVAPTHNQSHNTCQVNDSPGHKDILKHNLTEGDPRLNSPELVTPERLLFLDGTLQSMLHFEPIYHEALVHPAMFAHPGPKRVAVLGGGEGATVREVLKHNTIEHVTMIDIDSELIEIARQYLAPMSDCSDLVGRAANCFDDDLLTLHYEDGNAWFRERFGPGAKATATGNYDVVVVDVLDPEQDNDIIDHMYNDEMFVSSIMNSLTEDGVAVIQVGTTATIDDVRPDMGIYKRRESFFNIVEAHPDVEAMIVYEEPNCGFLEPHAFLVVCKSVECRSRWYARSDQVDYQIYERIVHTESGRRALQYYDGTTQRTYQWPKKGWETVYCRREPTPFECAYRSLDPAAELHELDLEDSEKSSFRIEYEHAEDGSVLSSKVFATKPIAKGSYIMADHLASSLQVTSRSLEGYRATASEVGAGSVASDIVEYFDKFRHESKAEGSKEYYVEVGGTSLIRRVDSAETANVGRWMPNHPGGAKPKFSPVYERNRRSFDLFLVASRDIRVGDEVTISSNVWA